ncbi:MAG: ATP-dependent RecD-like helicase [Caloramator sp.]|jgi:exodeoxyribonuclease V alpha subunit|uniref:SF1B family DNA helicase RecD2 n=1 Tax=Caloramator sp. TaxID=1871330 RepID=UPI001D4DE767|nr:ATP-dependent RecD-like DNA helicase [Caloramator sp.]MBZ4664591.1 ATP-dependent RecD-like helicase [Caloramator sp.]
MIDIEGVVENIVFKNEENGYTVAKIRYNKDLISVVGHIPFINIGQRVKVQGEWVFHPNFGQQIKVHYCEEVKPSTIEGIERYLASGLIKGIGPATAKKIVERFGKDSLDIIEMNPDKLTEVDGIGSKKAEKIAESFKEQRQLKEVMVFLQSYGITAGLGIKIFKRYGEETNAVLKSNPYRLCDEVSGVGFKTADRIAVNLGYDMMSEERVKAGIKYILSQCIANGHVYLPKEELVKECVKILNVPDEIIREQIVMLNLNKEIYIENVDNDEAVYLRYYYLSELYVARKLIELSFQNYNQDFDEIEEEIKEYEEENGIELAKEQREAIEKAVKNGVCVITGGPGTGKTTIIKCIIKLFEKRGLSVVLAAPTGRAAKRITETTGCEAKTIHRLLEMEYMPENEIPIFTKDEESPIEAHAIIIDEASMIDILLMNSLLKAVAKGTRLIIVGDVDQLPSVGAGNVLRDIIESGSICVAKLNKIFRQQDKSLITINAHKINNGEMPILNEKDKDFFFIELDGTQSLNDELVKLVSERLPSFKKDIDPVKDIQILSPMRKGDAGVNSLNISMQSVLNPPAKFKTEKNFRDFVFRRFDKVMQIKNNYNIEWESLVTGEKGRGVFNGDIGYIEDIDLENQQIIVMFDDKKVEYDFSNLEELELAYAITIHKSQGSEFKVVVIPVCFGPPMLMTRNLIYTGVTRAKELVVLIGNRAALKYMIKNNTITKRYSGLRCRIINYLKAIS